MNITQFFDNTGGLNITDSQLYLKDNQASDGLNFDLLRTGAVQKSRGRFKINQAADTALRSKGLMLYHSTEGAKILMRAADTKLQTMDIDSVLFLNTTEDTAAVNSDFFDSNINQQVVGSVFNTPSLNTVWMAGGGASSVLGYTGVKTTRNGVPAPTNPSMGTNFSLVVGGSDGAWTTTGTYYYALVLRKASTQALSNASLDIPATIVATTQHALLTFPSGVDTTKYDQWYVYRSEVAGVTNFTTGTLVAQVPTTTPTFNDTGNIQVAVAQVVPRPGNTTDNSVLEAGTYKYITAYKRQLITAKDSTVYFSELNKPESWPIDKNITIPTGGPITGLAVIGFSAPITSNVDEYLVIFKEREIWVVTGTGTLDTTLEIYDLELKFVDNVGCSNQALAVNVGGFLAWVDARGVYMWSGSGKPVYVSQGIEAMFGYDGDLNKTLLNLGFGVFSRKQNQIIWHVSSRLYGENSLLLKLDLRLTAPEVNQGFDKTIIPGVFTPGRTNSLYAGLSYLPDNNDEVYLAGDSAGYVYRMFYDTADDGAGVDFYYTTKALDFGKPSISKVVHKVVAWIDQTAPKDLELRYWSNYRISLSEYSKVVQTMDPGTKVPSSLWETAIWDVSLWDDAVPKLTGLVYNLHSQENNNTGDAFRFSFVQNDKNAPVTIHGFTVYWSESSTQK